MQFEAFARGHGLLIEHVRPVAEIQRCPTVEHPRARNGAWFFDGQRGWVCAWDDGGEIRWFDDPARRWTAEDKRRLYSQRLALRERADRKNELAAQRAGSILRACRTDRHGYLRLKGLPEARCLVTPDDDLLVPMRSLSGSLVGAQIVHWDAEDRRWIKKMLPGMKAKAAVLSIGSPTARETVLCEGYATALSIHAALTLTRIDARALVCFSDSNLAHVAPMVKGRVMVFADNDESGAGERAAQKTGLPYVMSDVVGEDANDMHQRAGVYQLGSRLMELRRM